MSEGLLRQVERWQQMIVSSLLQQQPALSLPQCNHQTQNLIINLLGLKLCEQHCLISPGHLHQLCQAVNVYEQLCHLVETVSTVYPPLLLPLEQATIPNGLLSDILIQLEACWSAGIEIEILGQAYERCLSQLKVANSHANTHKPSAQKAGGSYYTPRAIAEDILHNTLDHLPSSIPTILDPACGGGIFLLTAYQRLLQKHETPLPYNKRRSLLLSCIFGVDIDPQAIAVAKLSLWLQLLLGESAPLASPLPNLDGNLQCGNTLMSFDWHDAFPNVVEAGGFDRVVGNPPYIDSEWMTATLPEWRRYCAAHYQTAVGNWDLFCVFIEKGLDLCKTGGLMSFVVPNKLASAAYAAKVRSLLTRNNQLLAIHDYSRLPVFAASVYPLVFVVQKGIATSPSSIEYALMTLADGHSNPVIERSHCFDYDLYARHPEQPWLIPSSNTSATWLTKLQHTFPLLGEIAQVTGAATVAEAYDLRSLLQEKLEPEPGDLRMVNSGTIDRYCLLWGKKPLRYLGASYWHPVVTRSQAQHLPQKRWQQASHPKIVVAGMTRGLECALDETGGTLAGKSTSVICSSIDLRYLLGILNSSLIQLYFVSHFGGNCLQGGYLRVGPPQLKQIPIPLPDLNNTGNCFHRETTSQSSLYAYMLELVDLRLSQGRSRESLGLLDRQINHLVYQLYGLTDTEIEQVEEWERENGKSKEEKIKNKG